jgi:hypothetical protein
MTTQQAASVTRKYRTLLSQPFHATTDGRACWHRYDLILKNMNIAVLKT